MGASSACQHKAPKRSHLLVMDGGREMHTTLQAGWQVTKLCLGLCWQHTAGTAAAGTAQHDPGSRGTCATTKMSQLGKGEARKSASTALPCPANPRRNKQRQQGEGERMSLPPSLVALWCHSSNTWRNSQWWEPMEVPGLCW